MSGPDLRVKGRQIKRVGGWSNSKNGMVCLRSKNCSDRHYCNKYLPII